jgi:hypothetical protein
MVTRILRGAALAVLVLLFAVGVGAQGIIDWHDHPAEFMAKVLNGEHRGASYVLLHGENPDIQGSVEEDIWSYGGDLNWDSGAVTLYISSTVGGDTMDVLVEGLDANGDEVSETETLAGLTFTPLTQTFWRVHRATIQGGTPPTGDVYVHIDSVDGDANGIPDTAQTDTRAFIAAGEEIGNNGFYTCPRAKTCYAIDLHCHGGLITNNGDCRYFSRESSSDPWVENAHTDSNSNGVFSSTLVIRWEALADMKASGIVDGAVARVFDARALILIYDN